MTENGSLRLSRGDMFIIPPQRASRKRRTTARLYCNSVEYINENYTDDLSLKEICKRNAMSKNSFCKLFGAMTGTSFKNHLNFCSIQGAIKYIKQGYNISVIYGLVGYNDFTTFYRNFKRIIGCSPMNISNA